MSPKSFLKDTRPLLIEEWDTIKNNLPSIRPDLLTEWDYLKNNILPEKISFSSHKKIWWVCKTCKYSWNTSPNKRTSCGRGCPACSNQVVTEKNNLLFINPTVSIEYDTHKNVLSPDKHIVRSGKKVWWLCSTCKHSWKAEIKQRAVRGTGCPLCAKGRISRISQRWLDTLNIPVDKREIYLSDVGVRVDGYDSETKTVYEFLGDYWHGNPKKYLGVDKNKDLNISYAELYKKTIDRFIKIKNKGYKIIFIWETEFNTTSQYCIFDST
jgi:hypothetical protein